MLTERDKMFSSTEEENKKEEIADEAFDLLYSQIENGNIGDIEFDAGSIISTNYGYLIPDDEKTIYTLQWEA